jgi:hypothetical protein
LAQELAAPKPLTVCQEFLSEERSSGEWIFLPPFLVKERFEEVAEQAGQCLGAPARVDALCFWLDYLSLYLSKYAGGRGLLTRQLGADRVHRVIDDVIEASTDFSRWLSESPRNPIRVLAEKSSESPTLNGPPSPDQHAGDPMTNQGEAWAAEQNRKQEARTRIVEALRSIVPYNQWPSFVQAWETDPGTKPKFSHQVLLLPFQPPAFERLGQQSIDEWKNSADAAWEQHRNRIIAQQQAAEERGIDEKIPTLKRIRGQGKTNHNANIEERYKWAARRLLGGGWKEIAEDADESTVRKAASQVLHTAGWPTKLSAIKQPSNNVR